MVRVIGEFMQRALAEAKPKLAHSRFVAPIRPWYREARLALGLYPQFVPTEALTRFFTMAVEEQASRTDGPLTYFEAGVFAGQSMSIWYSVAERHRTPTRIFGADSFQGLPASAESDVGGWNEGDFSCPLPTTKRNLRRLGVPLERVRLIEGWFDESLTSELGREVGTVHVAMLDADTYSSTVPVLDFLSDLLDDVAWVVFDDWFTGGNYDPETSTSRGVGVEQAFREWHRAHPEWTAREVGTYDLTHGGVTFPAGMVMRLERNRP